MNNTNTLTIVKSSLFVGNKYTLPSWVTTGSESGKKYISTNPMVI